jgi:hypothetical protein
MFHHNNSSSEKESLTCSLGIELLIESWASQEVAHHPFQRARQLAPESVQQVGVIGALVLGPENTIVD